MHIFVQQVHVARRSVNLLTWRVAYLAGSFAIGEYIDAEAMDYLQLMHSSIYYEYTLAYTVRMWPLRDALDTLITRVVQSGIQSVWEWRVNVKTSLDSLRGSVHLRVTVAV